MALLAAYSFDETGDIVTDYSGNGRDFTLAATAGARTTGHTNTGLTKNNVGEIVVAQPPFGETANRTLMCWTLGTGGIWWLRWQVNAIDSGAWGILNLSGQVGIQARNASTFVRPSVPVPADGLWHHWAGTYDGSTVRLFQDGVEAASAALAGPLRAADVLDLAHWDHTTATVMDDLRMFDATLTAAEITEQMNTPVAAASPAYLVRHRAAGVWTDALVARHRAAGVWTDAVDVRVLPYP